jgi:hypothetical protein
VPLLPPGPPLKGLETPPSPPSLSLRSPQGQGGTGGDGGRSTQGSRVCVKTSDCSGGLRPPALRTNTFGAHRAPLQRKKAGFHTDSHALGYAISPLKGLVRLTSRINGTGH